MHGSDDEVKRHAVGCRYWNTGCEGDCDCRPASTCVEIGARYAENLRALVDNMKAAYTTHVIVGYDPAFGPDSTVVSTTCARCHATLPEMTEATVDAVIAAHQERCVIVGDYVRWEFPKQRRWAEGTLVSSTDMGFWTKHRMMVDSECGDWNDEAEGPDDKYPTPGFEHDFGVDSHSGTTIRRIPRPGQVDPATGIRMPQNAAEWSAVMGEAGISASGPIQYQSTVVGWTRVERPEQEICQGCGAHVIKTDCTDHCDACRAKIGLPAIASLTVTVGASNAQSPMLYDGLTAEECLDLYIWRQRSETIAAAPFTSNQLTAARAMWSAQLAAKVAASAEAERLTVLVDDQSEP
jgi:hypothetical protein